MTSNIFLNLMKNMKKMSFFQITDCRILVRDRENKKRLVESMRGTSVWFRFHRSEYLDFENH